MSARILGGAGRIESREKGIISILNIAKYFPGIRDSSNFKIGLIVQYKYSK